ncbi:DUF1980 domain-containing protein [Rossellomorea vietnamensis]|uniref:DUF1980 domain-containing protein n=1 Tax=Rossellomorea vietnamensis TaxID=218284 RepID=A0A6I6UMZ2_9BACI|nr:DUF1980 domain-containing protein [Rossellomorea vietnamensis]
MNSSVRFHTYIRGIILLGYALLLLKLFLTFNLQYFIAPRMNGYLYFALGIFLLLGPFRSSGEHLPMQRLILVIVKDMNCREGR